ncbi:MAG: hypothetical protein IJX90_11330 [Blautia sp.]|nr:hypothetical protein [Blautia sp.]
MAEETKETGYLRLPEVSEEDFCAYTDREDFLRRYGNPVVIRGKNHRDLVCMAWEYYERLMQDLSMFIEDENIKYWIYEFSMPWEKKLEFDRACAMCEMTPDEFLEAAVTDVLGRAKTDPEGLKRDRKEIEEHPEQELQMHLVRYYPVFKGETEAQALKRKLAEEAARKKEEEGS